ncbi:MAG: hypothetical protein Q9165_006676 [Trypethelium subeluteriae]
MHGGPAACHEYILSLTDLNDTYGVPIIFYDQIGNGKSTRLKEKAGDREFWVEELFQSELDNLIDFFDLRNRHTGYNILGQSWGGMMAAKWAAKNLIGLRKLVLSDSPASTPLQLQGEVPLRKALPQKVQDVLDKCERENDFESKEYEEACLFFYRRHLCCLDPWPEEVMKALEHLQDDPTVYGTMMGPSELHVTGTLRDWTAVDDVHNIKVETLLINGRYDLIQDVAVMPYFERIPKVKWVTLEKSSHMGHWEERERYMDIVSNFLGVKEHR